MTFCTVLIQEREKAKVTHEMLSLRFGLPKQQFRCYENGAIIPSVDLLNQMCEYLSCSARTKDRLLNLRSKLQVKYPDDIIPSKQDKQPVHA